MMRVMCLLLLFESLWLSARHVTERQHKPEAVSCRHAIYASHSDLAPSAMPAYLLLLVTGSSPCASAVGTAAHNRVLFTLVNAGLVGIHTQHSLSGCLYRGPQHCLFCSSWLL